MSFSLTGERLNEKRHKVQRLATSLTPWPWEIIGGPKRVGLIYDIKSANCSI